jgi:hypothetical protein
MVETKKVTLSMDIEIEIPKDIVLDKKRMKKVQEGILKVISKGPYVKVHCNNAFQLSSYGVERKAARFCLILCNSSKNLSKLLEILSDVSSL